MRILLLACLGLACATTPPMSLQEQIDHAGSVLVLAPGSLPGDVVINRPITIQGAPDQGTTITGQTGFTVSSPGVRLESLRIESADADVQVNKGADVAIEDSTLHCGAPQTSVGVHVNQGTLRAARISMEGDCRRDVEVTGGAVELHRVTIRGTPQTAIHAVDSRLLLSDVDIQGLPNGGYGLFAARCQIQATALQVTGGENGVLLRDSETHLEGFRGSGSHQAALAILGGHIDLQDAALTGPFRQGAIAALDASHLKATHVEVRSAGLTGLFAVGAHVDIHDMKVDDASTDADGDFGHGFSITRSQAELHDISVTHAKGAAIYVSSVDGSADVNGCTADFVSGAAAAVLGARLRLHDLKATHTLVGLFAKENSRIDISDSRLQTAVGVISCDTSTVHESGKVVIDSKQPHAPCPSGGEHPH